MFFVTRYPSMKPDPKAYLRKHEGEVIKTRGPEVVAKPNPPSAGRYHCEHTQLPLLQIISEKATCPINGCYCELV
jgi:hypothetical protein